MNARLLPSTYMRPLANSPWMRRHEPRFCRSFVLAVFFWQFLQAISKDIPGTRREIFRNLVNTNSTKNNTRGKTSVNETTLTDQNEEDFHLAYSGYLRSSSSMLLLQTSDITHNDFLSTNNNTSFDKSLNSSEHKRSKRGVTHLYNMIVCATGCDPLSYKGYGCYCGFLGSGYPMDGIDRCCKMHDWCYDATNCPMFVEYFVPYYWKCYHGYKPICAIEHGEWGNSGSCAQRLCECDRSFAECLRRYRCPRHKAVCTSSPWRLIQNIFMIV